MSVVHGRGRLTDEDRARIHELAARGMKSGAIAREIKRHPSTVSWFMYSEGLQAPRPTPSTGSSYVRNGRIVRRFSLEEDTFIEALRIQGYSHEAIAEHASKRFSTERSAHVIKCRLIMLAARDVE